MVKFQLCCKTLLKFVALTLNTYTYIHNKFTLQMSKADTNDLFELWNDDTSTLVIGINWVIYDKLINKSLINYISSFLRLITIGY